MCNCIKKMISFLLRSFFFAHLSFDIDGLLPNFHAGRKAVSVFHEDSLEKNCHYRPRLNWDQVNLGIAFWFAQVCVFFRADHLFVCCLFVSVFELAICLPVCLFVCLRADRHLAEARHLDLPLLPELHHVLPRHELRAALR